VVQDGVFLEIGLRTLWTPQLRSDNVITLPIHQQHICELIIFGYNKYGSGMIIIDDIMSEIELEISRVRRTSEMFCFNLI
jgi:hypothetical protein